MPMRMQKPTPAPMPMPSFVLLLTGAWAVAGAAVCWVASDEAVGVAASKRTLLADGKTAPEVRGA